MKKNFLILLAACLLALLTTNTVSAQSNRVEKRITPVKGKKLVLKGAVRDGDEVAYRFKGRAGQTVNVKIIGRDADFSVYLIYGLDAQLITEDTKNWTGKLPADFNGTCEIAVHSTYKLADYRLKILLKRRNRKT
jgi:hypothetical protein